MAMLFGTAEQRNFACGTPGFVVNGQMAGVGTCATSRGKRPESVFGDKPEEIAVRFDNLRAVDPTQKTGTSKRKAPGGHLPRRGVATYLSNAISRAGTAPGTLGHNPSASRAYCAANPLLADDTIGVLDTNSFCQAVSNAKPMVTQTAITYPRPLLVRGGRGSVAT